MSFLIRKKPPYNPVAAKLYKTQKKLKRLKICLFLLFTLPVALVTIGQAVIKEYVRIRVRQAVNDLPAVQIIPPSALL